MEPLHVPPGHMTTHQVAGQLGISLSGVRQLVRRGRLARAGGSPRQPYFATADVMALIRSRAAA
ncbi:helix-turn-helix domain-containing protein [Streptomyces bohaiensis]|uniref:helix-turn-helix domain-containing protein n=1 Tax=Streptomyces bohaiensis TaxID=1431344 RepID=UPI003B75E99D